MCDFVCELSTESSFDEHNKARSVKYLKIELQYT